LDVDQRDCAGGRNVLQIWLGRSIGMSILSSIIGKPLTNL
jgi:hypothetical protein